MARRFLHSRSRRSKISNYLARLFPQSAPGVTLPGYAFDFNDLTEEKLAWRRNLFAFTQGDTGFTAAGTTPPVVTSSVTFLGELATSVVFTAAQAPNYAGARAGRDANSTIQATVQQGTNYWWSARISLSRVLVGAESVAIYVTGASGMPVGVINAANSAQYVGQFADVAPAAGLAGGTGLVRPVIYKGDTLLSDVTVYMNCFQIEKQGVARTPYQALTDVGTEFLAAFPRHSLFRDNLFAVPCYQLEDPCGGALDMRFGGLRGPELATNTSFIGLPAGGGTRTYQTGANLIAERYYEITADVSGYSGTLNVGLAGGSGLVQIPIAGNGRIRSIQKVNVSGQSAFMFTANTNTANFTNVSVREVYGNHAVQATVGDRPIISAKYNQYLNSAWIGGGPAPTNWSQGGGAQGTSVPNGVIDGNVIYRQAAVALRPFLQPPSITMAVGQVMTSSLRVHSIYSGSVVISNLVNWVAVTGNGTSVYYINGAPTAAGAGEVVPPDCEIAVVFTCTTAGTVQPRAGLGTSAAATADLDISRPLLSPGPITAKERYQRTETGGVYDYAGFPINARFNGINQSLSGNVDPLGSDKLVWAATPRKESDLAAAAATLNELTAIYNSTPGSFVLFAPAAQNTPEWRFGYNISGTGGARTKQALGYPAPVQSILSMAIDAAVVTGDQLVARVNGTALVTANVNSGVGPFATSSFHIGRRNGATNPFNGAVNRLVARFAPFGEETLWMAERWANEKTNWAIA